MIELYCILYNIKNQILTHFYILKNIFWHDTNDIKFVKKCVYLSRRRESEEKQDNLIVLTINIRVMLAIELSMNIKDSNKI
jgi:hypothetical protein